MTRMRNILVPIDFSPGSLSAAKRAGERAKAFHSRVHLLHAAPPADVRFGAIDPYWRERQPFQDPVAWTRHWFAGRPQMRRCRL